MTVCALTSLARPASITSDILLRLVAVWPVWRPVVRLSAAGEGGSTVSDWYPQPLFLRKLNFLFENAFYE